MEGDLEVIICIGGIIIYISDSKPRPASISNESFPLRIPLSEVFKGVPALVAATCRYVEIYNIEDASASEVGSITFIGVQLFWRDVVGY